MNRSIFVWDILPQLVPGLFQSVQLKAEYEKQVFTKQIKNNLMNKGCLDFQNECSLSTNFEHQ